MTREEKLDWLYRLKSEIFVFMPKEWLIPMADALDDAIKALEQEPCEDTISRKSIKHKLQEHHDFFVNAYGGFSNLPLNDKSRVDEITNCIAMVVNEPPVTPQELFINKPCVSSEVCEHDKNKVLDKIRTEIETKYGQCDICEYFEDYDYEENDISEYRPIGNIADILQIIDKYKAETEETDGTNKQA